ncbi:hypothetical protein MAL08_15655 [Leptospira noguchii]|uniref:hypothetical protein n=1 Tax=Leptospira noguchii TaxID=28182 RepID=UPI001FB7DB68|nr:hypothetical protein [Leptospira noguchii]UOG37461.1 hypothetical protein MAL08_15655 [Leptospira noguchii]
MERKELNETLFTKALETQHNAFLNSASRFYWRSTGRVVGVVAPEFIICPDFFTSNSR